MKKRTIKTLTTALIITATMTFGATAFAGWGMDSGFRGWRHNGPGWHHGDRDGLRDWRNDLSDEETEELGAQRQAFLKDTDSLRQDLYSKELELKSELVKPEPDQKTALAVQKEISKLRAQLDRKHIAHLLQMKKINPNIGRGYAEGGSRGFGRSGRSGYGKGYGPGNCGR